MKCLRISEDLDICVTVQVKLIDRRPPATKVSEQLRRNETADKASYLGSRHEESIAEEIRAALMKPSA